MDFTSKKTPLHWRFSKVKSPRYKSKSWKAGQAKRRVWARPFSFKNQGKRERKVWTKGKERHKRRWIIQYAPLVDSFVILYNGVGEESVDSVKTVSFFLSHHALMLGEKMSPFCCKYLQCSCRWFVNPAGYKWPTFFWRVCSLRTTQPRWGHVCWKMW